MSALVETAFNADDCMSTSGSGRIVEAILYLIEQMLDGRTASPLCERGVKAAVLVLQHVPPSVAQICSQSGDEASAFGLRIIDSCLSKLVDVCDEAEKKLAIFVAAAGEKPLNAPGSSADANADATTVLHIALVCTEGLAICYEKMSPGDEGLLKSPAIWKSVLEGTNAIAVYLVRSFECACRLFAHCMHAALRRQSQYAAASTSLYKASGKVMDQISAIFSADIHLAADTGRKRSLLERYCNSALSTHKAIMSSPPQFKAVWDALCTIATSFSAASFDSFGLCLKVCIQSCETVRTLASQAVAILRRTDTGGLGDLKLQRRVKGILAFVRFIVFQMPSLLSKIQGSASTNGSTRVVPAAMAMLDVLFGELTLPQLLVAMPKDISTMIGSLVPTVSTKFTLALFSCYPELLFGYLDRLQQCTCAADDSMDAEQQNPLLEGIRSPAANREIIRAIVAGISAFSVEQQEKLFTHAVPLLMALSMAIDHDAASVFSVTMGDSQIHGEQQSAMMEYEQLVCSAALCASKLATPALVGHWETAALRTILQAPQGSLGTQMVVDAWGLLATKALSPAAVTSTTAGILDVITYSPERVSETGRYLIKLLLAQFFPVCSEDDLVQCVAATFERVVEQQSTPRIELLCAVIPWHLCVPETAVYNIGRHLLDGAISLLESCDAIGDHAAIFSGLAVLLPTYQLDKRGVANDEIWRHAYVVFEKALEQGEAADAAEWQHGVESILQLAISLAEGGYSRSAELLALCGRSVSNPMLQQDRAAFLVARFAGSFAATNLMAPSMEPAVAALCRVFGHLLGENMPWIVRHQASLQIIRFATEAVNQSIAESLVPEDLQEKLLQFIQCVPGGEAVETADQRRAVYQQAFGSCSWHLASQKGYIEDHANGDNGRLEQVLGDIRSLQQRLELALQQPIPASMRETIQSELVRLVQTSKRFPQG
ncbi:hypothetical protein GGF43_000558 [Coemansia sp. RSA 2618]|nr:hypothetical protein GGF43_000558 [Coemansia sp. RSA 2618]